MRFLDDLDRRTSSGRYIPQLDGIRGVAIAMVLLFHTQAILNVVSGVSRIVPPFGRISRIPGGGGEIDPLSRVVLQGFLGIDLFFVASGFVLALPFLAHRLEGARPVGLSAFYRRRLSRLQLPYVLGLTLSLLAGLLLVSGSSWGRLLPHYAAGVVYLHGPLLGGVNPVDGPLWTMEVEIQFYVALPALAVLFLIRSTTARRLAILAAAAAVTLWQTAYPPTSSFFAVSAANYAQFFLLGFLLADLYVVDWKRHPSPSRWWDLVALIGWPAFLVVGMVGPVWSDHAVVPWLILPLFVAAFRGPLTSRVLGYRWLVSLGAVSYSVYLIHYPAVILVARGIEPLLTGVHLADLGILTAVALPTALLAGLLFFRWVERPCMDPDWPSRLMGSLRRPSSPEPPRAVDGR